MDRSGEKRRSDSDLLLAFLLPAAVFLLTLLRYRILPFGERTLLFSDLDSQYIEFMAEYRRILLGDGSFFYSWRAGMGMNFIALIAYYLASPFNFLLVLFPETGLPLAVSVLTVLKLGCAGLAFAFFLRERYKRSGVFIPVFSAFWALSAFALGYAFNIMWLDALIWLPLICMGIERLISGRKYGMSLLILFYALSFISQFYMAWMTGFFSVIYLAARLLMRDLKAKYRFRLIVSFGICAGIAAGVSAILLLPTFFVLKNNMGLMGQEFPPASGAFPFFGIFGKLFIGSFDGIKNCLPHIYCGLPALIGLALYFAAKDIPVREKTVSGLIGAFLLFSFWFRPLDFILHAMDHPSWFPFRYAFLFAFWALGCAFEGFMAAGIGQRSVWACVIWMILPAAAALSGSSLPRWFLPLNLAFLAAYAVCGIFRDERTRSLLFAVCCAAELAVSSGMIIGDFSGGYTLLEDYRNFHDRYRSLAAEVRPPDDDFYRMEKSVIRNYNDPLGSGFPGISHFSSTASSRQSEFLKRLGFNCYATWCTYQGSTPVTDALLRIRYEFGEKGKTGSILAGDGIWEHDAVFPLFFFADEGYIRYDLFSDADSPISRQNALMRLLDDENGPDYFEEIPLKFIRMENLGLSGDDIYTRLDIAKPAFIEYEVQTDPSRSSCIFIPNASLNYNVYIDSTLVINAGRDYAPFPVCPDLYTDGNAVTVRIGIDAEPFTGGIRAYSLDPERLRTLADKVNAAAPVMERVSETGFRLRTEAADEDRLIVSSIPFDAGWRVKVEGKPLERKMIHDSVLGFILPASCEDAEVYFRPYGWETGVGLSITALLLWTAVFILEKRRKTGLAA